MNNDKNSWLFAVIVFLVFAGFLGAFGIFSTFKLPESPEPPEPSPSPSKTPLKTSTPSPSPRGIPNSLSSVKNVPRGTFNYGGSTTFAPLRSQKIVTAIRNAHPQFKLRYTEPLGGKKPGSGTGIQMLIENELAFSQSSRAVKDKEFERAKNRGFTIKPIPVAIDGIAFYINRGLINRGVRGITLEQGKKIFTGEITNWKDLGGPDEEITLFSRNLKAGGTVDFFYEKVLEKQPLAESFIEVQDTTDSIRKVAKAPGGIGYATASEVVGQQTISPIPLARDGNSQFVSPCADTCESVNQENFADGSYPLTRRLFVVIKQDNGLDEEAGSAYANMILSDEGQDFVEEAGFVPIRK